MIIIFGNVGNGSGAADQAERIIVIYYAPDRSKVFLESPVGGVLIDGREGVVFFYPPGNRKPV